MACLRSGSALSELYVAVDELEASVKATRRAIHRAARKQGAEKQLRREMNSQDRALTAKTPKTSKVTGILVREDVAPLRSPVPRAPKEDPADDPKNGIRDRPQEPSATPRTVVINCANVGTVFCESRKQLYAAQLTETGGSKKGFMWEGVRRAFQYYESHGLKPQGVCKNRTAVLSPVPDDLKSRVIVCPVVDDQRDTDDLFTIRLAMRYGCQLVDNDNYRDWKHQENKRGTDDIIRDWLLGAGARLKVSYVFDRTGRFIPSVPPRD